MRVKKIGEHGYEEALLGLSLNFNRNPADMPEVLFSLSGRDDGENKVLEMMCVWLDVTAPRYFWSQFDTYRIGISKSSQSTMHTLTKKVLAQEDFATNIPESYLEYLNSYLLKVKGREEGYTLQGLKGLLPEGFLQRRIIGANYKSLRNIVRQRKSHKLPEWKKFCLEVRAQLRHPEFLD